MVLRFFFILFFCSTNLFGQSTSELLKLAVEKEKLIDEAGALALYTKVISIDPKNVQALCAASFLCSRLGGKQAVEAEKISLFKSAKKFADLAVKLEPKSAEPYFVTSVALGRLALVSSLKEKVAYSRNIKLNIDKALAINPNHAKAWHVLAKFNYEVSVLTFVQKKAANMVLGGLPDGDINKAIKYYEKCRSLDNGYIVNLLDLAIAYKKNNQKDKALFICKEGIAANIRFGEDAGFKASITKLMKSL